uniref:Protein kinase domain-containing protein n=1 Tax=Romanomermis culicivorax TaxID=13658 RepID=A0A915L7Y6_ROMCU
MKESINVTEKEIQKRRDSAKCSRMSFGYEQMQMTMLDIQIETCDVQYKKIANDLLLEICVLRRLQGNGHFTRLIHYGTYEGRNFFVMQILGANLSDVRRSCPERKLTMSTAMRLGSQCLDAVEALHDTSFLHRGIKLINFALGPTPSDQRNVYLLDFSMVRRFKIPPDNKVRPARRYAVYRGALTYASPNNLMHRDAGRCDDLCSWFYCLAEMAGGDLPWERTGYDIGQRLRSNESYKTSSISLSKMIKLEKLAKQKLDSRQELLKNFPTELATLYDEIFSLQYDDQPDYKLYK